MIKILFEIRQDTSLFYVFCGCIKTIIKYERQLKSLFYNKIIEELGGLFILVLLAMI